MSQSISVEAAHPPSQTPSYSVCFQFRSKSKESESSRENDVLWPEGGDSELPTSYVMSFCRGGRWMFLTTHFTIHSMPSLTPSLLAQMSLSAQSRVSPTQASAFLLKIVWSYEDLNAIHWNTVKTKNKIGHCSAFWLLVGWWFPMLVSNSSLMNNKRVVMVKHFVHL